MTTALKRSISALDGAADAGAASSKRPHLHAPTHDAAANGNGAAEDDEADEPAYRGLDVSAGRCVRHGGISRLTPSHQVYRKEAIYRHLLEARRDLARAERRASSLQASWDDTQRSCEEWRSLWDTVSRVPGFSVAVPMVAQRAQQRLFATASSAAHTCLSSSCKICNG
jgi:hypothetical protein